MTDLDTLSSSFKKELEEFEKVKKNFFEKSKTLLQDLIKTFFDFVPEVYAIAWSQYTPYFNDGEECIFRVNEPSIMTKEVFEEYKDDRSIFWESKRLFGVSQPSSYVLKSVDYNSYAAERVRKYNDFIKNNPDKVAALEAEATFINMFNSIDEEIFKSVFDDHVSVVFTREKGFEIEEYEHD